MDERFDQLVATNKRANEVAGEDPLNAPQIGCPKVVYENPYQRIYRVDADFGEFTKNYFVSDTGHRAGVLVVDRGMVLLVRQYRLLLNGLSWEIPGGKVDEGEAPEGAAVRECLEETGTRCLNLRPLVFYHKGLDTAYNPTHIFLAEEISESHEPDGVHFEEVSGWEWVPLDRCVEMIFNQEIVDCLTIVALLAHQSRKGQQVQTHR
jgi:ADP-ribose pyrophosphatase